MVPVDGKLGLLVGPNEGLALGTHGIRGFPTAVVVLETACVIIVADDVPAEVLVARVPVAEAVLGASRAVVAAGELVARFSAVGNPFGGGVGVGEAKNGRGLGAS